MSIIKTFTGAATAGLLAIGTYTAQAETRTWTGASEVNKNWTTAENWSDNTAPTDSDTASIGTADIVIDVEGSEESNPAVGALSVGANAKVNFSGQKRLYTGTSNSSIGSAAEITIQGIDNPCIPEGDDPDITNASVIVRGAQNTMAKNAKVTVTGKGSKFEMQNLSLNASSVNTFTANNGGEIDFSPYTKESKTLYLTLNSVGGGFYWPKNASGQQLTISGGKLTLNITNSWSSFQGYSIGNCAVVANLKDTTVKFGGFASSSAGSIILDDSGFKTDWGFTYGNSNASSIEMKGTDPYVQSTGGGISIGKYVTVTLVPELAWDTKSMPLFKHAHTSKGYVYFRSGWQCKVDVSKFAHYYGSKTVVFAQSLWTTATAFDINLPTVTCFGEGCENCKVTFSRDKKATNSTVMYMTIEAQNPPVGSVAKIERDGVKNYYDSIENAIAAAGSDETVVLIDNVALTNAVVVNKQVTLDLGAFTVACDEGGFASTNLFRVTGGALTVKGTGAVEGGTNAAVCVTGGAFSTPAASTVTFSSSNDAIVVSSADATVEILGGTFMSEDGQPVVSAVSGILRGGKFNKEPALALIAEGYTTEKVGDLWEVVVDGVPICEVNGRKYASLEKAYAAVPNNGDIFIIADATVPPLTMDRDIAFTLALQGFTLTPETAGTLFTVEAGTVDFYDFGEPMGALKGGIVVKGGTVNVIAVVDADPALTVDGGTVTVVRSTFNGTVTLNGGTLNLNATVDAAGVAIAANGGTLNVTGGSYTGGTSAFAAGQDFSGKGISAGSFSSAIDSAYLKNNRLMKQVDDHYEVVLASDEKSVTYTWKGGAEGDWANPDNWTPSTTPCFGIPSNNYATAKFSSASENIVVNLGGGSYPVGTFNYSHDWRQMLTNGAVRLSSGSLGGDRRLILENVAATVVDPVFANAFDFNLQLNGGVKIDGDVSPNGSTGVKKSWNSYSCLYVAEGSNEVTGVIHNRNTQLDVVVAANATLVAGEIKADSNANDLPLNVSLNKGASLKVGQIVSADVAGKFAFTFNVPVGGLASAPVVFAQNTGDVALNDKTAITVNFDEGFKAGCVPLISGTSLSSDASLTVNGNFPKRTRFELKSRDGVILLEVKPSGTIITIR